MISILAKETLNRVIRLSPRRSLALSALSPLTLGGIEDPSPPLPGSSSKLREPHHRYGFQVTRWKHGAKMGQRLQKLDEQAHQESRAQAQERRSKKKKAAKKKKGNGEEAENVTVASMEGLLVTGDTDEVEDLHRDEDDDEDVEEGALPDLDIIKGRMEKIIGQFEVSLKGIREAEPTPDMFDNIQVNAYGTQTPLKGVAQVVIQSHTLATATCFDPTLATAVSTAIGTKLGLNPSVEEGGEVKIPLPRVSLETRRRTATILNKRAESYRQRIRNARRKVMDTTKKGVAGKLDGVSKDDAFRLQQDIESTTENYIKRLNETAEVKHRRIMAV